MTESRPFVQPASAEPAKPGRLVSLDAFRGITIAGMILVNNPGSWSHIYGPLRHAQWHGWTPTDLVFPFFLFIVGTAMAFSFSRRAAQGAATGQLLFQVARRSVILVCLGLFMYGFPDWRLIGPFVLVIAGLGMAGGGSTARQVIGWILAAAGAAYFALDFGYFEASRLRVPGVLQRIGVCYFGASLIVLLFGWAGRIASVLVILVGYALVVAYVSPPANYAGAVVGAEGRLHDWLDVRVLGEHLYRERPDPEGLLSTLPAIATVLLGVMAGGWLRSGRSMMEKAAGLFFVSNVLVVAGLWLAYVDPINKKIWTSSYVILTGGLAGHFLAACYFLIDIKGRRAWAWPFVVFGSNAIVVFVASSILAKMMGRWKVDVDGGTISVKGWIYREWFASWAAPLNASLAFALAYIAMWLLLMIPLYRGRVFVKI